VAMIAASAALTISGVPFMGPIGGCRVGFKDGEYTLNPSMAQVAEGRLDLVVAATHDAVMMVESEAKELTEDEMLGAVMFAHEESKKVVGAIIKLAEQAAKDPWELAASDNSAMKAEIKKLVGDDIAKAYKLTDKSARSNALNEARAKVKAAYADQDGQTSMTANKLTKKVEADIVRTAILKDGSRIDGRKLDQVRPIEATVGFLPRTHGSALFTRGETQAICTTTLGTKDSEQMIDGLAACRTKASCCTTTSRPTRSVKWAASAPRVGAKSATASSPGARCARCCRRRKSSPTPSASSATSPSPTARARWRRCAAGAWR
jgi:polyribonucleotide nucleotidyltransferase